MNKGYNPIDIKFGKPEDGKEEEKTTSKDGKKIAPSELPKEVEDLMKFIFDFKLIEASVVKTGYDAKRMPLGQLSS